MSCRDGQEQAEYTCATVIPPEEGITVKGADVSQNFHSVYCGQLEENAHVIVIRLKGVDGKKIVKAPLLTRSKVKCETCGRKNKSGSKFCHNCGTALM